jgi:hypothetical protein
VSTRIQLTGGRRRCCVVRDKTTTRIVPGRTVFQSNGVSAEKAVVETKRGEHLSMHECAKLGLLRGAHRFTGLVGFDAGVPDLVRQSCRRRKPGPGGFDDLGYLQDHVLANYGELCPIARLAIGE